MLPMHITKLKPHKRMTTPYPKLTERIYLLHGVTRPANFLHVNLKHLMNGEILIAESWCKEAVANYWSVIRFNDLYRWLRDGWREDDIVYHRPA